MYPSGWVVRPTNQWTRAVYRDSLYRRLCNGPEPCIMDWIGAPPCGQIQTTTNHSKQQFYSNIPYGNNEVGQSAAVWVTPMFLSLTESSTNELTTCPRHQLVNFWRVLLWNPPNVSSGTNNWGNVFQIPEGTSASVFWENWSIKRYALSECLASVFEIHIDV